MPLIYIITETHSTRVIIAFPLYRQKSNESETIGNASMFKKMNKL